VILVGCVKTKREQPSAVRDLYESALFKRRRWYAERRGVPWFVLSAEFGLVAPDEWLSPYDLELGRTSMEYRAAWAIWSVARLERLIGSLVGLAVEVHAGEAYVSAIEGPLAVRGAQVTAPLKGFGLGEQLAWYDTVEPVENHLVEGPPGGASSYATVTAAGGAGEVVAEVRTNLSQVRVPAHGPRGRLALGCSRDATLWVHSPRSNRAVK